MTAQRPESADVGGGWRTRGQTAAVAAVRSMLGSRVPHALLLVGPASVGKTTLALDAAAALLCTSQTPAGRPCRACRACHLVDDGNHPDLHRLAPEGAGRQISIEAIRALTSDLALLPVEGGARIAVLEGAHRLNEDAQNALLKTLEEPPSGVTIILAADDEERLLPTIKSRCARVRLGPVGTRDIELLLGELGVADAPTAARLARVADGRPGLALAYARAPESVTVRSEIARSVLDLLREPPGRRLALVRELVAQAASLAVALDTAPARPVSRPLGLTGQRRRPGRQAGATSIAAQDELEITMRDAPHAAVVGPGPGDQPSEPPDEPTSKAPPSERRRAALALVAVWRDVARDLVLAGSARRGAVRDPGLLEELDAVRPLVSDAALIGFLARIERTALAVENNANPELALDVLALSWTAAQAA